MGGLNTLIAMLKSPKGQKISFISHADPTFIERYIEAIEQKVQVYADVLLGDRVSGRVK